MLKTVQFHFGFDIPFKVVGFKFGFSHKIFKLYSQKMLNKKNLWENCTDINPHSTESFLKIHETFNLCKLGKIYLPKFSENWVKILMSHFNKCLSSNLLH